MLKIPEIYIIVVMRKIFVVFIAIIMYVANAHCVSTRAAIASRNTVAARAVGANSGTTEYNYNNMYPYLNNQMRTSMNPGTINSQSNSPINTIVRTSSAGNARRVVARPTAARAATAGLAIAQPATQNRRVVPRSNIARSATNVGVVPRAVRSDVSVNTTRASGAAVGVINPTTKSGTISSARCLTDYTECMNKYCLRESTAYNRCYCSARLAQIDATYKGDIDNLVRQIQVLKNGGGSFTDDEFNAYWMSTIGKYTGDNSWVNIDNILNGIDWSTMESRVRGQTAYATGHEYCTQHLRGCFYMASNMRDAYRSEIARDCKSYENALQWIKNAAETVVANYQE